MDFEQFFKQFCSNCDGKPGNFGCDDMPDGFQDINPEFFVMLGSILGTISAGQMPFNVQNVLGNWLQLVGQAIETYNAQQQYMQGGPGRYYDIRNKNVSNPTCPEASQSTTTSSSTGTSKKKNSCNCEKEISELKGKIKSLEDKIERLNEKLDERK